MGIAIRDTKTDMAYIICGQLVDELRVGSVGAAVGLQFSIMRLLMWT